MRLIGGFIVVCSGAVGVVGVYNLQSDFAGTQLEGWLYVAAAIGASFHGVAHALSSFRGAPLEDGRRKALRIDVGYPTTM